MPLLKDGKVIADRWVAVDLDGALPDDAPVILPVARWRRDRAALVERSGALGLRLPNTEDVGALAVDLDRFALIALEFPKFNDGRAYSQARLLRERHGWRGELRATGQVLRDQLLFMHRAGFDSFEMAHADPETAWRAALSEITVFYQPTGQSAAR
jgi:uncharacterized protein (DUF934 family)